MPGAMNCRPSACTDAGVCANKEFAENAGMPSIWSRAHPRFSFRPLAINVVSELRKPRPDSRVVNFIAAQPGETLFVTDITLAEIVFGIEQMGDATRRTDLHLWLERNLRPSFAGVFFP